MSKEKKAAVKLITPKGIFVYPWLTKADTRFNPDGVYSCSLAIPQDQAQELIKKLDVLLEAAYQEAIEAKPQDKKKLKKVEPYSDQVDSQGEETGNILIKTKLKAKIKTKDGSEFTQAPRLFDSKGKPLPKDIAPYGGSEGKLSLEIAPYVSQASKEVGLSLRLKAVQVIKLVQGGQGGSADAYGFEEEEDGFEVTESTTSDIVEEDEDF